MTPTPFASIPQVFRPLLALLCLLSCAQLACKRPEPGTPPSSQGTNAQPLDASADTSRHDASPDQAEALDPWHIERPDPRKDLPALTARPTSWRRGISLGLFASDGDREAHGKIYRELLDEIVATGATDVSIVVRWSQQTIHTDEIQPKDHITVPDELVREVLEEAHARGLRTFLLPIVWLEERKMGIWRGTISPNDPEAWWRHYTAFIHHYATLAEQEDVALFSVGSELLSMETKDERWRALIASTRTLYKGELTYSANWDHFEVPTFWDALDVVGMTAYQELTNTPNPDLEELKRGWYSFQARLRIWANEHNYRYIFTEIGYPSHRKGAAHPWNYSARAEPAPWLQARCYRAMMEQWEGDSRLDGLYIWNWFGFKDLEDRGYTPRGKPAAQIVEHWYKNNVPLNK